MFKESDISIIIPTYNRVVDLKTTLLDIIKASSKLLEIIVVDQSTNGQTKNLCLELKKKIPQLKYLFSKTPSITIARNLGVIKSSKKSKIICFLDDDVSPQKNYFNRILDVFNTYPEALAVAGHFSPPPFSKIENAIKKFFILQSYTKDSAKILSAYGNTYPFTLTKTIKSEWMPGVNMCYKKSIFSEQKFDENLLGYTIAEDIGFSYSLYKKHPNSIFITPHATILHRVSQEQRYPSKRMAYINQIDHFYFFFKNLSSSKIHWLKLFWNILGISIFRPLNFIVHPSKINFLSTKYYFISLFYVLFNLRKIRAGKVREFVS